MSKVTLKVEVDEKDYNALKQTGGVYLDRYDQVSAELLKSILNATPITESDDCVSRQEVEQLLRCGCAYDIWNLPSVTPKREQGKWIFEEVGVRTQVLKCSKCGTIIQRGENFTQEEFRNYINDILREKCITLDNFCHNCGAEMTEGGD